MAGRSGGTPPGGPRRTPGRGSRTSRGRSAGHQLRRRPGTSRTADRTARRHGHLSPLVGHRQPQHRTAPRHRNRNPAHQRRRLRENGDGGFRLFPHPRRRASGRHQLDRRDPGTRVGSRLLGDQADAEHLHRRPGAAFTHGGVRHPVHGHPSGIRGDPAAGRRRALPDADAGRKGRGAHHAHSPQAAR